MAEIYTLEALNGALDFSAARDGIPDWVFSQGKKAMPPKGWRVACRMGDPDLIHCLVFRNEAGTGGIFGVYDKDSQLLAAKAETNLAYALAMGFFGELTANARYGVDVFENMEEPDD